MWQVKMMSKVKLVNTVNRLKLAFIAKQVNSVKLLTLAPELLSALR